MFTISDALSSTGGFLGLIDIVVVLLIGRMQETLFNKSIIKAFFTEDKECESLDTSNKKT